jgi:hypothetical protein
LSNCAKFGIVFTLHKFFFDSQSLKLRRFIVLQLVQLARARSVDARKCLVELSGSFFGFRNRLRDPRQLDEFYGDVEFHGFDVSRFFA